MNNKIDKPKRSPEELVEMLKIEKGIQFVRMGEKDAEDYLRSHNNYLRTASYRKNYEKHQSGENEGKYIHLDFAYLVELSKLDLYLRNILLPMCIDIEHALKCAIISDVETNPSENGYDIVTAFLNERPDVVKTITQKADAVFTKDLVEAYFELCYVIDKEKESIRTDVLKIDCPVWVLVELLAFNDFLHFAEFYCEKYPGRMKINKKHLNIVRSLRNACAHNNCLLVSLRPGSSNPPGTISQIVSKINGVAKEERKNKLSCRPLLEIVCLLVEYNWLVSEQVRKRRMADLKEFADGRLTEHSDFFEKNQVVSTAINFLQKIIDNYA